MKEFRALILPLLAALLLLGGPARVGAAHQETCDDNTCVFFLPGDVNFAGARNVCRAENADLATLRSAAEVQSLRLPSQGRFWIGLTRPADGPCPVNELVTGGPPTVSGWAGLPDRCDHRCVSVSTDGSWQQEPCGGTLNGSLCAAPSGRCLVSERSAEPGVHAVSVGSVDAQWAPLAAEWTMRRGEDSAHFESKWLCGFGVWVKAPWTCEVLRGGCAHKCLNHTCVCPEGRALHANNVTCVDVHKCEGGAQCACTDGYEEEGGRCVPVKNCEHCEHMKCDRLGGADVCRCHRGFVVSLEDPTRCQLYCDRPECPAGCPGKGMACSCPLGYILNGEDEQALCMDLDECVHEEPCEQQCVNTLGSYTCSCHPGFTTHGDKCVAADVPAPPPTAGVPSYVRVGSVLGMAVFVAVGAALLYLLLRGVVRHSRGLELALLRRARVDILTLQQVTTEKYQRFSFDKQSWADGQRL